MKHLQYLPCTLLLAAAVCVPVDASAINIATSPQPATFQTPMQKNPFCYATKPKAHNPFEFDKTSKARKVAPGQTMTLAESNEVGYLDGPDGSSWHFTAEYDIELVKYEAYTEKLVKGYTYTIYDSEFNLIGKISDTVTFREGETRLAAASIGSQVTQKFFNYDNNYEIYVSLMMNTGPEYGYAVHSYSKAYSLNGATDENGNSKCIAQIEGYPCAIINGAKDSWSEDFYISFITEETADPDDYSFDDYPEFLMNCYQTITTYKKVSYSGELQCIHTIKTPYPTLPGDLMSTPPFISFVHDKTPYFVTQRYEKMFYDNAVGPDETGNGNPTPDNNLLVDIYTYSGYGSELTHLQHTKIPTSQEDPDSNILLKFFSVGLLDYDGDFIFNGDQIDFILTVQKYQLSDDDNYLESFFHVNAEGETTMTIIENSDNYLGLSDIPGKERQFMFIVTNDDTASAATYHFIDIYSGNEILALPSNINGIGLKVNVDRYPVGNSYEYAFETMNVTENNGDVIEDVAWVTTDGDISHVDEINLGKDIALATVYIEQSALSPYLFNTDPAREYMWLVKRYIAAGSTATNEELTVVSTNGSTLFTATPDDNKGALSFIALLNADNNPTLQIVYANNATYTNEYHLLPLSSFENGGDGTLENPYKIATIGDLQLIKHNLTAHYEIINDIDGDGYTFHSIPGDFKGTLNGNNHTIKGIHFEGRNGIFENVNSETAIIKDLTITGASMGDITSSYVGFIVGNLTQGTIDNVHIHGATFKSSEKDYTFGGIVGNAVLNSNINNCSVTSADIYLPASNTVGGIAGQTRTGTKINACSFMGQLTGESTVGGIAGCIASDVFVTDCHVDADIAGCNTVGGIVGESMRGPIKHCYVEGSVAATSPVSVNYDFGPCAGGVVGLLNPKNSGGDSGTSVDYGDVITGCFVNLTSLTGYTPVREPRYPAEHKTIHRIVGKTSVNEEPDVKNYDSEGKPIYSTVPMATEYNISNNYVISTLNRGQSDINAAENTTEGADIDSDQLDLNWFKNTLGFSYGNDIWNEASDWDPALCHETGSYANPTEIKVEVGKQFNINVIFVSRIPVTEENLFDTFYFNCDEQVVEMTGAYTFFGNTMSVEFNALNPGTTVVDICNAKCNVTVTKSLSGVDNIATENNEPVISFNGNAIVADGCRLAVYSTTGALIATGNDSVTVANLAAGTYVATAVNADGDKATAKIIVK